MRYAQYDFVCRFKGPAILPPYKGSTIRGVFGHALKRVACVLRTNRCEQCPLVGDCLYAMMFIKPPPPSGVAVRSSRPHPFVFQTQDGGRTEYSASDRFECSLILFGSINDKLPYFVFAFREMGKIGMGKRIHGRRGPFELEKVTCGDHLVYESGSDTVAVPGQLRYLTPKADGNVTVSGCKKLQLKLLTPLRFKSNGRLGRQLDFRELVRLSLRRMSSLMDAFGQGEPKLDYTGIIKRSEKVKTVTSSLRWFDWQRFSNRQQRHVQLGGLVGDVTYQGDLDEFLPYINFCQKTHLGKNTSFGLGRFVIEQADGKGKEV